jgi:hypothetical protein
MFLGEGKHANNHQSHQDKSGYDILHHGYHSGQSFGDVRFIGCGLIAGYAKSAVLNPSARSLNYTT